MTRTQISCFLEVAMLHFRRLSTSMGMPKIRSDQAALKQYCLFLMFRAGRIISSKRLEGISNVRGFPCAYIRYNVRQRNPNAITGIP